MKEDASVGLNCKSAFRRKATLATANRSSLIGHHLIQISQIKPAECSDPVTSARVPTGGRLRANIVVKWLREPPRTPDIVTNRPEISNVTLGEPTLGAKALLVLWICERNKKSPTPIAENTGVKIKEGISPIRRTSEKQKEVIRAVASSETSVEICSNAQEGLIHSSEGHILNFEHLTPWREKNDGVGVNFTERF